MTSVGSKSKRVATPASTGGAGTFFEQHVDTAFLTLLLVRGIPPILSDCSVTEVHIQTERSGWNTDDVLVVGENGAGRRLRLIGQVKRTFTVSSSDEECKATIVGFWKDFQGNSDFSVSDDRFAIITQRGTNTFLAHFAGLLDCARTSLDCADFEHRLQTPGFVNKKVVHYCGEIQKILEEHDGLTIPLDELWPFLKLIHALNFDLASSTRQTETVYKTLLAYTSDEQDAIGAADATWNDLLREAGEGMTNGKSYRRENLPQRLQERHSAVSDSGQQALKLLGEHSELILKGISTTIGSKTTIGSECHLRRDQLVQRLLEELEINQVVIVTGPAGSGKSGIAKNAIEHLTDTFTFSFRAKEFSVAHLDETLQRIPIPVNGTTLGALLAGQSQKVLLVESLERLLEASTREAFTDLLTLLKEDGSWRLIVTCREYSTDLVRSSMLQFADVGHSVLTVPSLNDDELTEIEASLPELSRPLSNPSLRTLLRNPYLLDKASQMPWPENRPLPEDERAFREKFWADVIRVDDRTADGMPRRRQDTFVRIALQRARALSEYAPSPSSTVQCWRAWFLRGEGAWVFTTFRFNC
jgi:tRNA A37 threonylcarbamoyladenosine biosynthesis protein TsaE